MLPGPYERWFVEMVGRPSPVETRSTCDACAMAPGSPDLPPEGAFDPALRCCTYHPHLAAHLVGAILERGDSPGSDIVRARIAERAGVTPIGIGPDARWAAAWKQSGTRPGAFGRDHSLLCPFLANERCTIWESRGAPCASFHCKFDRGVSGASLWNLLTLAFNHIERALARWLLQRMALDAAATDALLQYPADPTLQSRAWGSFHGKEEEYFRAASQLIAPLSWKEVVAIGGRDLTAIEDTLTATMKRLASNDLPSRVQRGEVLIQIGKPGTARLFHPAAPLDLLEIPADLAPRLARFHEGEIADLEIDDSLLRKLLDWQALIAR